MNFPGIITVKQYSSTQAAPNAPATLLSPAVWAKAPLEDCLIGVLGKGVYTNFSRGQVDVAAYVDTNGTAAAVSTFVSTICVPGDDVLKLNSGSTSNTAVGLIRSQPLGPISPGGNSVWFETSLVPASSTNAQTVFAGLTVAAGLASGTGLFATESTLSTNLPLVGFYMTSTTPNNVSCVYQAASGGLQTVLANVLTASTANPNPGSLTYQPVSAPGAFLASNANTVKLGIEYNADANQLNYYVNGYVAATFQPTAGNFDTVDDFGAIVAVGGANQTIYVDFLAAAAQLQR